MEGDIFSRLLVFLGKLSAQKISYSMGFIRDNSLMVTVAIPGERWEVEFMSDGDLEIEVFRSKGEIAHGQEALQLLETLISSQAD